MRNLSLLADCMALKVDKTHFWDWRIVGGRLYIDGFLRFKSDISIASRGCMGFNRLHQAS